MDETDSNALKWTFPIGTYEHILTRMESLGVPRICSDESWEGWQVLVKKFLAGGLWITTITEGEGKRIRSHEVR